MPLGKLLAVRSVNKGDVRPCRHIPSHCIIDHHLSCRVIQVVIPPDHMGHPHVMIIDNDGQHINRCAIGPEQNHVIKLFIAYFYVTLYLIPNNGIARQRCFDPHRIRRIRMGVRGRVTPGRTVQRAASLGLGRITKRGDLVLGREAFIGFP